MTDLTFEIAANRVLVTGELDMHTAADLKSAILSLLEPGADIVVDLAGLSFIDSSGLAVFIAAHKRATQVGASVSLDNVPDFVSRILAITGLAGIFHVLGGADA